MAPLLALCAYERGRLKDFQHREVVKEPNHFFKITIYQSKQQVKRRSNKTRRVDNALIQPHDEIQMIAWYNQTQTEMSVV